MPFAYLIEGPVGAGKSTYAQQLALQTQGVHIALDAWFAKLYSPDRPNADAIPWYLERKQRLIELIWQHSKNLLQSGKSAALELGLIQREARTAFCRAVLDEGYAMQIHVLDAPLEVRRQRVQQRNKEKGSTFAMEVPDTMFELASHLWEPPDEVECEEFTIKLVATG